MANPPIPNYPVRDLKFEALTKCAHEDWDLPNLKNPNLESVSLNFRANIARARFMMLLPTSIAGQMALTQRANDIAEYEITGTVIRNELSLSSDIRSKIDMLRNEILLIHQQESLSKRDTPEWDSGVVGKFHLEAADALKGLTETPLGAYGFLNVLSASVIDVWGTIETMLGDLWEAALNCHPKGLASLRGKPRRIGKDRAESQLDATTVGRDFESKSVALYLIEKSGFDIRSRMGTIFREQRRFEFIRLSSIREAYSCAFSEKSSRIDAALSNKSFDAMSAVRNVFVHKAGKADAEYIRHTSYLAIPKGIPGEPVLLDGKIVADLIRPVITSTKSLMIAVDDWIEQH